MSITSILFPVPETTAASSCLLASSENLVGREQHLQNISPQTSHPGNPKAQRRAGPSLWGDMPSPPLVCVFWWPKERTMHPGQGVHLLRYPNQPWPHVPCVLGAPQASWDCQISGYALKKSSNDLQHRSPRTTLPPLWCVPHMLSLNFTSASTLHLPLHLRSAFLLKFPL